MYEMDSALNSHLGTHRKLKTLRWLQLNIIYRVIHTFWKPGENTCYITWNFTNIQKMQYFKELPHKISLLSSYLHVGLKGGSEKLVVLQRKAAEVIYWQSNNYLEHAEQRNPQWRSGLCCRSSSGVIPAHKSGLQTSQSHTGSSLKEHIWYSKCRLSTGYSFTWL